MIYAEHSLLYQMAVGNIIIMDIGGHFWNVVNADKRCLLDDNLRALNFIFIVEVVMSIEFI